MHPHESRAVLPSSAGDDELMRPHGAQPHGASLATPYSVNRRSKEDLMPFNDHHVEPQK